MQIAFEQLTKRLSPKLNAITHKLNGRFLFFNEEDLYQEAMIDLWQKYSKGELSDKTDSYVLQGCFFFLKNYIRKIYKKIDMNSISLNEIINNEDNTFEDVLFSKDVINEFLDIDNELLKEHISSHLDSREKDVVGLSLSGLTTREMGRMLGISHVMVVKIKNRIKVKLKNKLNDFKGTI